MLRNFAANITGKRPGKHWPGRFLKQHNNDLICLYTTGMDAARVGADSAYEYNHEVCVEWWWEGLVGQDLEISSVMLMDARKS